MLLVKTRFDISVLVQATMPIDKFGRHHFNRDHDESQTVVLKELPKLYYETRLLIMVIGTAYSYKLTTSSGLIVHVTFSTPLLEHINNVPVQKSELIGRTLKKGDVIRLNPDVRYSLKVPIIIEDV